MKIRKFDRLVLEKETYERIVKIICSQDAFTVQEEDVTPEKSLEHEDPGLGLGVDFSGALEIAGQIENDLKVRSSQRLDWILTTPLGQIAEYFAGLLAEKASAEAAK